MYFFFFYAVQWFWGSSQLLSAVYSFLLLLLFVTHTVFYCATVSHFVDTLTVWWNWNCSQFWTICSVLNSLKCCESKTLVIVFLWAYIFTCLEDISKSRVAEPILWQTAEQIFQVIVPFYTSISMHEGSNFSKTSPTVVILYNNVENHF